MKWLKRDMVLEWSTSTQSRREGGGSAPMGGDTATAAAVCAMAAAGVAARVCVRIARQVKDNCVSQPASCSLMQPAARQAPAPFGISRRWREAA
jgi:hypothetical protein